MDKVALTNRNNKKLITANKCYNIFSESLNYNGLQQLINECVDRCLKKYLRENAINFSKDVQYLYHATPACYVNSIKKYGLGGKMPNVRLWDYNGTPYEKIVQGCFLATDEYVAESYLEASEEFEELCETYEEDLEIVVFRINTNDLDLSLLSEDENQIQEGDESEKTYFYNGIIPFEKLEKITLYENVIKEAAPEVDEYEIGDEGSNPPVGGNFYHVNESTSFDSSEIGAVNYSWDFDEEEYQEWLVDAEYENTQEALMEYINDNVEFELEYLDNETYHTCGCDYVDYNTLEDMFGEKMQKEILTTCMSDGSGSFETVNLYSDDDVDINDRNSVNNMAMRLLRHGDYFKDCRGFILTNGVVVYTESEHNEICRIPNINNKFDFIRMGNIRILPQSIDIGAAPTSEQRSVLRKVIASYANEELYLDIYQGKSSIGAKYIQPDWRYVMGEIDRFFSEGIKPQGNGFYEGKKSQIVENKYDNLFNKANYDLQYFIKQGKEKYGTDGWYRVSWMKAKHPEIKIDEKDIRIYNALSQKLNDITKLWNEEEYKEENEKMNSKPTENYDIISLAVEEFGTTSRLSQAGYILPDGNLLNFGSGGYRETDHRQIAAVYKQNNISIWNDEYRYNYVVDFMNHGAIRCDVNSGILDMTKEPTKEQYYVLKNFVRNAVDVDIDFTDDKGNTLHSVSYSDAKPQAVVADIMRYYEEGIKPMGNVQYEGKRNASLVENYDFEVNSSEIDLSSFKKKHELVPNIWKPNGKLDSRIRLKLLDIADDFWKYVNLTWVKPSGIILTGSICNFNWSQYSDIDLHLIVDFDEIDEKTEFVKDYLDSKKNEWNNEHSGLQIMGYPVELYVQNLGEMPESNGIYDLEENDWVREPNPDDIKSIGLNKFSIKEKAAKIMTIIDDMYDALASTDDSHKIEQMGDDASYLWKKVKEMRKSSLEKNGESGSGNIVYKILRREFYLDKLWRLKVLCYDKLNSITESTNAENIDIFSLAKERFGTTNDIRECGYVLPDGSMLDFSGRHMVTGDTDTSHLKGRRSVDHREIGDLNWDIDITTRNNLNINMEDFIRKGAIRIHCSNTWSSINLFVKPTKEQINPLLRLIQYSKGNVTVEIGDGDNSYEYAEWDEANPRRVINDVMRYFDGETINLVGNVRESIRKYSNAITLLKEEVVADGNSEHNPYKKRWEAERKALKDFICNFGKVMTSKENGKTYKVYYDKTLSQLIGYNYCICLQWDAVNLKPKSVLYIRALDKFTDKMFQANFDARGRDNMAGTYDDINTY